MASIREDKTTARRAAIANFKVKKPIEVLADAKLRGFSDLVMLDDKDIRAIVRSGCWVWLRIWAVIVCLMPLRRATGSWVCLWQACSVSLLGWGSSLIVNWRMLMLFPLQGG